MAKLFHIVAAIFFAVPLFAQISIERQVISPTGSYGTGSYTLSYTVGQPEYTTGFSADHALTNGFQQPSVQDPIIVELVIEQPGCSNDELGTILIGELGGCADNDPLVTINGEEVELPLQGLEEGLYSIEINAGFNCSYAEEVELILSDEFCDLIFYNVITPNTDNFNDNWIIENIGDYNNGQNEVSIINRWGNVVYDAQNYNNNDVVWDGRNKDGNVLPAATYFYIVKIGDNNFTGYVEVLR